MTTKALIVDDEAPVRRVLRRFIESEGLEVIEAADAEEALGLMADHEDVAAVFSDMRMPGHDGLWLAERLRAEHPATAVVMTTGVHEFDVAVTSLQSGVVDYVAKPLTLERLRQALRRALLAHGSRRAAADTERELEKRRSQIAEACAELEMNSSASVGVILGMIQDGAPGSYERAHRIARVAVNLGLALGIREPELSALERRALLHDLPTHLKPQEHTLPGRIIELACAFDDLTSGRAGTAVPAEDAIDVLTGRRSEFDPAVLEALRTLCPSPAASSCPSRF